MDVAWDTPKNQRSTLIDWHDSFGWHRASMVKRCVGYSTLSKVEWHLLPMDSDMDPGAGVGRIEQGDFSCTHADYLSMHLFQCTYINNVIVTRYRRTLPEHIQLDENPWMVFCTAPRMVAGFAPKHSPCYVLAWYLLARTCTTRATHPLRPSGHIGSICTQSSTFLSWIVSFDSPWASVHRCSCSV